MSHNLGHSGLSGKLTGAKTMATVRDLDNLETKAIATINVPFTSDDLVYIILETQNHN